VFEETQSNTVFTHTGLTTRYQTESY